VCVAVYKRHGPPNLRSLAASLTAALGGLTAELVVALNGVPPDDADVPEDASVVVFECNRGVPVAWNAASRAARASVLCIVNDDVLLGPGSLRLLYDALTRDPTAGVVGPVGTRWDIARAQHLSYLDLKGLAPGSRSECEVISGFLLVTPRRVFDDVGGFDEAYAPCGFEEVDYCTGVRRLGLRCYAVAGVDVVHEFTISSARPWRRIRYNGRSETIKSISRRNKRYFLEKWSAIGGLPVIASAVRTSDQ